ncbi:hypothetical protein DSECCO2_602530 [anaerobic digester metagenome]
MGELVARAKDLHAELAEELLVVVGAGAADEEHGGLAFGARTDLVHDLLDLKHLLFDDLLDAVDEFLVLEVGGHAAQRLGRGRGTDEVDLDPGDAELGFHHLGHVVERTVAHDGVEVGLVGDAEGIHRGVAGEGGDQGEAALLQDALDLERVAADVVLAEDVDLELALDRRFVIGADDVLHDLVVGDVVAGGLGHALVAFAGVGEDGDAELFLHLPGHGVDIVADQAHRAGGEDRNGPGMEVVVGFLDGRGELLHAAEHDVVLGHVRGEGVGDVVLPVGAGIGLVAAGQPGVEAAADGAVGQVDDVARGAENHAFATGVGAAALGDDARDGADVGLDFGNVAALGAGDHGLGPLARHLGGHLGDQFLLDLFGIQGLGAHLDATSLAL